MSIMTQAGDLIYTFRFLRILTTQWRDTDAFKLGIIDESGKRLKTPLNSGAKRDAYTPFVRMAFNIKRLVEKMPGGSNKISTFAAALYLIKENYNVSEPALISLIEKVSGLNVDLVKNLNEWFITADGMLSPGRYKLKSSAIAISTAEETGMRDSTVTVENNCYPVGNFAGVDLYECRMTRSGQAVYLTSEDLLK